MLAFFSACDLNAVRSEGDKPQDTAESVDTASCDEPTAWYVDADADGFGASQYTITACEQPDGHVADATDCDDTEATVSPSESEYCDGVDQNCNGEIDEGAAADAPFWYADTDADGFGDATDSVAACEMPTGYAELATDCDDSAATAYPGADEYCNNADDNCDGEIDEPAAIDVPIWYRDIDADGFGDPNSATAACEQPAGYSTDNNDCDDTRADANPAAPEICNGRDDDCDGYVDDDDNPTNPSTWYLDADLDGYGRSTAIIVACDQPDSYAATGDDCDDVDPDLHPGAAEYCDEVDADCDGLVAEDDSLDALPWFADFDSDGFGDAAAPYSACVLPEGYAEYDSDCDDADAGVFPTAVELCNGKDDDCEGTIDEVAVDAAAWYADLDGDGFGVDGAFTVACDAPPDSAHLSGDCDDSTSSIHPAVVETCADLTDLNCDGAIGGEDGDGDGVKACEDCDDTDAGAFPGAVEVCNEKDDDCDGDVDGTAIDRVGWYADWDGDGYGDANDETLACSRPEGLVSNSNDCDDFDPGVHPGAIEVCDGLDNDCSYGVDDDAVDALTWFADADNDGFGDAAVTDQGCELPTGTTEDSTDCDDTKSGVNPSASETCTTTDDDDCDGSTNEIGATNCTTYFYDGDGDGAGITTSSQCMCNASGDYDVTGVTTSNDDCDDTTPTISPLADEVCGGGDDDCDGLMDDADPSVVDQTTWYSDADGDGFGTAAASAESCSQPTGYVETDDDCDDTDGAISPEGVETCDDGVDQDCDGSDKVCGAVGSYTTDWGSEMIAISAGSFTMGGGAGDPVGSYTDHVVTLTHSFWIGETEITRGQWESSPANGSWTYGSMPRYPCTTSTNTDDCPADTMSWYEVAKYCNALSAQEGLTACYLADGTDLAAAYLTDPYACPGYRMPTEAEWEYAARAGEDTEFSGSNTVVSVAWYIVNANNLGTYAHQVATLAPNAWGLYDMSGNVYEWTNDRYLGLYGGYGSGAAQTDPAGPTSGGIRVGRGGSWNAVTSYVRVAYRYGVSPHGDHYGLGARLSRSNP